MCPSRGSLNLHIAAVLSSAGYNIPRLDELYLILKINDYKYYFWSTVFNCPRLLTILMGLMIVGSIPLSAPVLHASSSAWGMFLVILLAKYGPKRII